MRHVLIVGVLILAACSGDTSIKETNTALSASAAAKQFGVDHYVVEANEATLLAADGGKVGVLRVSSPSAETRSVTISYADGQESIVDVTRPLDGKFLVSPVLPGPVGAVLTDAALAPLFLAQDLAFQLSAEPVVAATDSLKTSGTPSCSAIPWAAGCSLSYCDGPYQSGSNLILYGYAGCQPRTTCSGSPYGYDQVMKTQTCPAVGSCTHQANGATGWCICSTDVQATGALCPWYSNCEPGCY